MDVVYSRIKKLRKEHGLTQKDLADKLGYDRSSISKIEQGQVDLSLDKVNEFAKVLGCSMDFLMGWEPLNNIPVDFACSVDEYPEIEERSHAILEQFKQNAKYLVIEDLFVANRFVNDRIEAFYKERDFRDEEQKFLDSVGDPIDEEKIPAGWIVPDKKNT